MEQETNKNAYFLKIEEKDKEAKQRESKKKIRKVVYWGLVLILAIVVIWWIFKLPKDGSTNKSSVNAQFFPAQSRNHIISGESHPDYNSNPPTGGWHYDASAQTGIYDRELPDEQLVHNLEHGHIWIAYHPDLDEVSINKLVDIAKSYSSKIIMTPRTKNNTIISLVAWEYLLKLNEFDEGLVQGFIKQYRGKGPESIPDFGFKDFRK